MAEGLATRPRRPAAQADAPPSGPPTPAPNEPEAPPEEPIPEAPETKETGPVETTEPAPPEGLSPMSEAPKTGRRIVLVSTEGREVVCVWRHSRTFSKGRWRSHEFWADPMNSWKPIPFSPIGWKEDEFKCLA